MKVMRIFKRIILCLLILSIVGYLFLTLNGKNQESVTATEENAPKENFNDKRESEYDESSEPAKSKSTKRNAYDNDNSNIIEKESEDQMQVEKEDRITATFNTGEVNVNEYFTKIKITDEIYDRIYNKSYKKNCPLPLEDLRYLELLYYGFDGETHVGEMIVNKNIADDVISIFKELYEAEYPIERMELVDEYNADDNASMLANNSSAFNFRYIDGTTTYSNHGKGLAIDINPLYNPYVRMKNGVREVLPVSGEKYADRSIDNKYYIKKNDICYNIFTKYGFTWGGDWKNSKDYQHFEKSIK